MKLYACKFCKEWTTRKRARGCLMTHIKTNKLHGDRGKKRPKSSITESMLRNERRLSK